MCWPTPAGAGQPALSHLSEEPSPDPWFLQVSLKVSLKPSRFLSSTVVHVLFQGRPCDTIPSSWAGCCLPDIRLELADELGWTRRGWMSQLPHGLSACAFGFGCIHRAHSRLTWCSEGCWSSGCDSQPLCDGQGAVTGLVPCSRAQRDAVLAAGSDPSEHSL